MRREGEETATRPRGACGRTDARGRGEQALGVLERPSARGRGKGRNHPLAEATGSDRTGGAGRERRGQAEGTDRKGYRATTRHHRTAAQGKRGAGESGRTGASAQALGERGQGRGQARRNLE